MIKVRVLRRYLTDNLRARFLTPSWNTTDLVYEEGGRVGKEAQAKDFASAAPRPEGYVYCLLRRHSGGTLSTKVSSCRSYRA